MNKAMNGKIGERKLSGNRGLGKGVNIRSRTRFLLGVISLLTAAAIWFHATSSCSRRRMTGFS
jgi:hypothetical protein